MLFLAVSDCDFLGFLLIQSLTVTVNFVSFSIKSDESELFDMVQPTVIRAPDNVAIADMAIVRQFTFT